jgi:hypothetical protein
MFYDVLSDVYVIYMRRSIMYLAIFYGVFSDVHLVYIGCSIVYFKMFAKYPCDILFQIFSITFFIFSLSFALDCIIFYLNVFSDIFSIFSSTVLPPSLKEYNYGLRATKSDSCLTKFLVNGIHIYGFKLIYYKNIFHN